MSQQKVESPLFQQGLKDGLPICLGYISVAFTFGMMATEGGLAPWSSLLISMTNLTSAGQFAGTALILSGGTLLEIAVTTFVINIRYMLMSLSLRNPLAMLSFPFYPLITVRSMSLICGIGKEI